MFLYKIEKKKTKIIVKVFLWNVDFSTISNECSEFSRNFESSFVTRNLARDLEHIFLLFFGNNYIQSRRNVIFFFLQLQDFAIGEWKWRKKFRNYRIWPRRINLLIQSLTCRLQLKRIAILGTSFCWPIEFYPLLDVYVALLLCTRHWTLD